MAREAHEPSSTRHVEEKVQKQKKVTKAKGVSPLPRVIQPSLPNQSRSSKQVNMDEDDDEDEEDWSNLAPWSDSLLPAAAAVATTATAAAAPIGRTTVLV